MHLFRRILRELFYQCLQFVDDVIFKRENFNFNISNLIIKDFIFEKLR